MEEEIQFILDTTKEAMDAAIKHLEKEFVNIRAGKASPAMLFSLTEASLNADVISPISS